MRVDYWERKLAEVIASRMNMPFKWGTQDCCMFSLACLDAVYGTDHQSEWEGKYKTERTAFKLLNERGGYEAILTEYGFSKLPAAQAQRGDAAFIGGQEAWGIVGGDQIFATGDKGLVTLDLSCAINVWRKLNG